MNEAVQLYQAQQALNQERCRCGAVPVISYVPGCLTIECGRCGNQLSLPDFDVPRILIGWNEN